MNDTLACDVAVLGAGTAGLAAERAARKSGARTLLIDPEFAGTTCALTACMPSKLLIAAARAAHRARNSEAFGIRVDGLCVDGEAVMKRVREERDRFARLTREGAIADVPSQNKVTACAKFVSEHCLELDTGVRVKATSIIIATGSTPNMPKEFAALGDRAVTTDDLFDMTDLPECMAVVGSGPIGLELAQAFARLGVKVTLFEKADRLGGIDCERVRRAVESMIRRDMEVHLAVDVEPHRTPTGAAIAWNGKTNGEVEFDRVLVAAGRSPKLEGLALEKTGLQCDDTGVPLHDRETMRCGESAIFLAGDVADDTPVLHEASHDGTIAGRNAAAVPVSVSTRRMASFTVTFTDPQIARIGKTGGADAMIVTADYGDQGRARVENRNEGCVTLYADRSDGTLIGASLCAPGGEHLAHMLAWAVERKQTASDLLNMPVYHPTLEEGLEGALKEICANTPVAVPEDRDRAEPSGL